MTAVRFAYTRPEADGTDAAATGYLLLALAIRESVSGIVRITERFRVDLVGGIADVELSATGPGQAWVVIEHGEIGYSRYALAVPESLTVVNASALQRVDVATLEPTAGPVPAWTVNAVTSPGGLTIDLVEALPPLEQQLPDHLYLVIPTL